MIKELKNEYAKRYFHIDCGTSMDQILTLLDTVQSDNEDEIVELVSDSDIEFIVPEDIELTGNSDNSRVLTTEAIVHVVDERTTYTKRTRDKQKKEKARRKYPNQLETHVSRHSRENCLLEKRVSTNFTKVLQFWISMNKLLISVF